MVYAKNISVEFPANSRRKGYRARRVISCTIDSTWQRLTDTCEISIGRNIKGLDLTEVRDLFRRGDEVIVYAGYNGNLVHEFSGYIVDILDEQNITFKCQDEMYQLKKGVINFNKKNCTLKQLIDVVAKGYTTDVIGAELGSVRIKNMTSAGVLEELKQKYGIYCFFRGKTLVAGKPYEGNSRRVKLNFDVLRNIKTHGLTYKRSEDIRVQVKVTSVLADGTKIEATAGDEDGATSEINLFGIKSKADLKAKAEEKLTLMKTDGYEGDITLLAEPRVVFGDEVEINSARYPERNGVYYADGTVFKYGPGAGIERIVKIGKKA